MAVAILGIECLLAGFLVCQSIHRTDDMITTSSLSWVHEVIEVVTALGNFVASRGRDMGRPDQGPAFWTKTGSVTGRPLWRQNSA